MTLRELATAINAHLKRIERDGLSIRTGDKASVWKGSGCYYMGGARLRITYISRQGGTTLSRPRAEAYLAWLDAGHVGRHEEHVAANQHATTQALDGAR